ncbi:MAG: phosphoribosyl-AMP cyclohydrolase [Bacteroidota bacterium]
MKSNSNFMLSVFIITFLLGNISCKENDPKENEMISENESKEVITKQDVRDAQQAWGDGIINIGKLFSEGGDYKAAAEEHISVFYNYQEGTVLFKPTLASEREFRTNFKGGLSYFIAGDENYPEDHGFAIKPWSEVRFDNLETKILGDIAISMGDYYFTPTDGSELVKAEYSFVYTRDKDGKLKIILHDSHLPYNPAE